MDNDVGKMLLKYPWILSTSIQENYEEILSVFHEKKVWIHLGHVELPGQVMIINWFRVKKVHA